MNEESKKLRDELANHVVKCRVGIVRFRKCDNDFTGGGSGSLIIYRDRLFLISVAHVTNKVDEVPKIELERIDDNGNNVFGLEYFNYIEELNLDELGLDKKLEKALKELDICYSEIKDTENFEIYQPKIVFNDIVITEDKKRMLFTDLNSKPDKGQQYSFYGKIKYRRYELELYRTDKLVLGLKYDKKIGPFERFLLGDEITDHEDYIGTSGAPIIGEDGDVVAFVSHGEEGTKHLYGFSAIELKKYLDIYIDMNPLDEDEKDSGKDEELTKD